MEIQSERYSGLSIICSWTWIPEDTSTHATSEYIKCNNCMCRKIKTTAFFMWLGSWCTDISLFYCFDANVCNMFLIDYTCSVCENPYKFTYQN